MMIDRRSSNAFTLTEVLIALAILAVAALALLQLQLTSIRLADRASVQTRAVMAAEKVLADLLAGGFPEVGSRAGSMDDDTALFQWRTEVADADAEPLRALSPAGLRRVAVTVSWRDGATPRHVRIETMVSEGR